MGTRYDNRKFIARRLSHNYDGVHKSLTVDCEDCEYKRAIAMQSQTTVLYCGVGQDFKILSPVHDMPWCRVKTIVPNGERSVMYLDKIINK